jgi:hypothetical protein
MRVLSVLENKLLFITILFYLSFFNFDFEYSVLVIEFDGFLIMRPSFYVKDNLWDGCSLFILDKLRDCCSLRLKFVIVDSTLLVKDVDGYILFWFSCLDFSYSVYF